MKKCILNWMTIALMAFVCVGLLSCSKSDDKSGDSGGNNNPLVGTWSFTKSGSSSDGTWSQTDTFVFNANNTGTKTSVGWASYKQQKQPYNFKDVFNYSATMVNSDSGILRVVFTSTEGRTVGKEYYWYFTITGNILAVNEGYDQGSDYTETYTRK